MNTYCIEWVLNGGVNGKITFYVFMDLILFCTATLKQIVLIFGLWLGKLNYSLLFWYFCTLRISFIVGYGVEWIYFGYHWMVLASDWWFNGISVSSFVLLYPLDFAKESFPLELTIIIFSCTRFVKFWMLCVGVRTYASRFAIDLYINFCLL